MSKNKPEPQICIASLLWVYQPLEWWFGYTIGLWWYTWLPIDKEAKKNNAKRSLFHSSFQVPRLRVLHFRRSWTGSFFGSSVELRFWYIPGPNGSYFVPNRLERVGKVPPHVEDFASKSSEGPFQPCSTFQGPYRIQPRIDIKVRSYRCMYLRYRPSSSTVFSLKISLPPFVNVLFAQERVHCKNTT